MHKMSKQGDVERDIDGLKYSRVQLYLLKMRDCQRIFDNPTFLEDDKDK